MPLQEFLHGLAVHLCLGREIIAAEEKREHGRRGEFAPVGGPDHLGEWIAMCGVDDGRAAFSKLGDVEPHRFQRPSRRAVAAGETAPYVLVRVDTYVHVVLTGFLHYRTHIVKVSLINKYRVQCARWLPM